VSTELFKWQLESAQKYDESERALGDVLDVKASVALIVATFLASVSAQLIAIQGLSPLWREIQLLGQIVALLSLSVAGALIFAELWPRDYLSLSTPKKDSEWIEQLVATGTDHTAVLNTVIHHKLSSAINRVEHNKKINDKKSAFLDWAFKLLAVAIVLVLGNLLCLAVRALCPLRESSSPPRLGSLNAPGIPNLFLAKLEERVRGRGWDVTNQQAAESIRIGVDREQGTFWVTNDSKLYIDQLSFACDVLHHDFVFFTWDVEVNGALPSGEIQWLIPGQSQRRTFPTSQETSHVTLLHNSTNDYETLHPSQVSWLLNKYKFHDCVVLDIADGREQDPRLG